MKNVNSCSSFLIKPSPNAPKWAWAVCAFIFALDVWLMISHGKTDKAIFALIPTTFLVVWVLANMALTMNKVRFEISEKGLQVHDDLCGKFVEANELDLANARIVNLETEKPLRPKWKLMGTALPGYSAGWFKLYDGGKALVFLTDLKEAVYVPTRKNYSLLLGAQDNVALLQAVKTLGAN